MEPSSVKSPFAIKNINLFIAFRIFFSSRFYYPVFTIFFLDLGLTIKQFALLNVVWAGTIVLLEVPSGALADILGRKKLLVTAGLLMVLEILLLCLAPRGNSTLLFVFLLCNRILSGTAEAAASGADEALAYDSLKEHGLSHEWDSVLEKQMRYQSIAFMISLSVGAAIYDPVLMQKIVNFLNLNINLTQGLTLRFPVFLTLVAAILTLITALRMREIGEAKMPECSTLETCTTSITSAFKLTFKAGGWILRTPFALVLISAGMLFDNVIRMIITLDSQYFRLIKLPEASFGIIGSGLAMLGVVIPRFARFLTQKQRPVSNFLLMAGLTAAGLYGMTFFTPYFGLIPVVLLFAVMFFSAFFLSHYLNNITSSSQRATVLSFKGLSYNLAYGIAGLLYSLLLAGLKPGIINSQPYLKPDGLENTVFMTSMNWFTWYFLATIAVFIVFSKIQLRNSHEHNTIS